MPAIRLVAKWLYILDPEGLSQAPTVSGFSGGTYELPESLDGATISSVTGSLATQDLTITIANDNAIGQITPNIGLTDVRSDS